MASPPLKPAPRKLQCETCLKWQAKSAFWVPDRTTGKMTISAARCKHCRRKLGPI